MYIVYVKVSFFKCMSMCKCNVINLQLYNMWVIRKRTKEDEEEEKKVNQKANITIIMLPDKVNKFAKCLIFV